MKRIVVSLLAAISLAPAAAVAQDASPTATPPPAQEPAPGEGVDRSSREGWYPVGGAPGTPRKESSSSSSSSKRRDGHRGGWGEGVDEEKDPWEVDDPNADSIFLFPTGQTVRRGQLTLGFPGPGGIPDIQYGLSDWLQIGAGYSLIGFTPTARLGLIRGRRADLSLVGGAYLPAGASHPFVGQFGGAVLSAGRDEFRVHLGYQFVQLWGDPFPDVRSVQGGLGMTGVEVKIAPRAKFLFMVANFAQMDTEPGTEPFYAVGVVPGVRVYGKNLSADVGAMVGQVYNLKMERDEEPRDGMFALPMITLRYRM